MPTDGERLHQRLTVEAPDFCTNTCKELARYLLELTERVDTGEAHSDEAFDPLSNLVKSCPKAVEAGGQSEITAARAREAVNSMVTGREGEAARCAFQTTAFWHADMYAKGGDPFDGYLHDDDDEGCFFSEGKLINFKDGEYWVAETGEKWPRLQDIDEDSIEFVLEDMLEDIDEFRKEN